MATRAEFPSQAETSFTGYAAINSVSRDALRFWNSFSQGTRPARSMIFANVVPMLALTE